MPTYQNKPETVQQVQEPPSEIDEYTLYQVEAGDRKPFKVDMQVDGKLLPMEIDTGALLSLVSEATYQQQWPHKRLLPNTTRLRTYTGEPLNVAC